MKNCFTFKKKKKRSMILIVEKKKVNNMQNAVCLNLYCVFLMRSRPD